MVNFFSIIWFDALSSFIVAFILLINTIPLLYKSILNIIDDSVDLEGLFIDEPNL